MPVKKYTIEEIKAIVEPIARKYGVARVYLFGSYARGDVIENSDVDFRGSTPSATAFGPFACLSTLKDSGYPLPSKTNYRRLANLTGRDSHPLYDAA
jgi:hypothetical protein